MYRWCLLMAGLICASNGRRVKATSERYFSSRDAKGQKLVGQMKSIASSMSHGEDNHSGSGQLLTSRANPRKIVPILLTFFSPAAVFAPSSNIFSLSCSIYDNTQSATSRTPIGAYAGSGGGGMIMDQTYVEEAPPETDGPIVRAVISVVWEGLELHKANLRAFNKFREWHPDVPLTHFLNAAYFTKHEGKSIQEWSPYQALTPIDEIGLHVNGLKSLVDSAAVQYRSEPNILLMPEELDELGVGTDISFYSVEELQAIVSTAVAILEKHGLTVGKSFRAGSWLAGPNVIEAIRREGFLVNSSALGFDEMIRKHVERFSPTENVLWQDRPLPARLREIWPGVTSEAEPFLVKTPGGEEIFEMPVTGGVADYTSARDMVDHFDSNVQQLDSEDRFVQIAFHQETASMTIERVIAAVVEIKRKHGHRVLFETLTASAHHAASARLEGGEVNLMHMDNP